MTSSAGGLEDDITLGAILTLGEMVSNNERWICNRVRLDEQRWYHLQRAFDLAGGPGDGRCKSPRRLQVSLGEQRWLDADGGRSMDEGRTEQTGPRLL